MKASSTILFSAIVLLTSGCVSNVPRGHAADSVHREYMRLAQESAKAPIEPELEYRYYEIELPEHEVEGVLIESHRRVIEIVE